MHKKVTFLACRKHMRRFDTTNRWFSLETIGLLCGQLTIDNLADWRRSFISPSLKLK